MLRSCIHTLMLALASLCVPSASDGESSFHLQYDKPATKWTEALPVGNGRIGAMVFGGTEEEQLQVNESTLWGGGPHDYTNPEAYTHLGETRSLIFADKVEEAEKLSATMMGKPKQLMPYQPFCDLRLHFPGYGHATQHGRSLDLDDAIADAHYKIGAVDFRREVFISYPDQVLIVRLTASEPGQLTFRVGMDSSQPKTQEESKSDNTLQLTGQIQPRQNPPRSWTGSWSEPGMKFAAVLRVLAQGGSVHSVQAHLEISGANSVTILFSNSISVRPFRSTATWAVQRP